MHCPGCGARIESDEISYCTRCGQTLGRVRLALSDETAIARGKEISRPGLNLGVVLMYAGLWPALLLMIASPTAIPIAYLMLTAVLVAIIFGSGTLLRLFQIEELHPEIVSARRKEISFGSTLMYLAAIMATLVVATGVPDSWVKVLLIGKITAAFLALLMFSKPLYSAYGALTTNDSTTSGLSGAHVGPAPLESAPGTRELVTGSFDAEAVVELKLPEKSLVTSEPGTVTESTTRSLDRK